MVNQVIKSLFANTATRKPPTAQGVIPYGKSKNGGGHDHRTNTGDDRTPAQKEGDRKRTKN